MCIRDSIRWLPGGLWLSGYIRNGNIHICGHSQAEAHRTVCQSGVRRVCIRDSLIKHPCFDEMRAEKKGYRVVGTLENTDRIMSDTFWVGVYPGLTDEKIDYMAKVIKEGLLQ